jgi:hypothetical protein
LWTVTAGRGWLSWGFRLSDCLGLSCSGGRWPVLSAFFRAFRGWWGGSQDSYVGCRSRRCSYPTSTTEVANVTADLDTRCGELYALGDELLPAGRAGSDRAAAFACSRQQFESLISFLDGTDAAGLSHAELEDRLAVDGRELLRRLLDDHLALRAAREQRLEQVAGDEGVVRTRVESGHERALETVFGTVTVERLAYRAPGVGNLHPADAALNLPLERHSHGLRKLAALEAARGSFQDATDAIERVTGQRLGKRQVEELASLAAMDFEDFYENRRPTRSKRGDLLVLSCDGKGIVMRADALRTRAPARPRAGPAKPSLSGDQRQGRKRMAEIGAVYDAKPAPRVRRGCWWVRPRRWS